MIELGILGLMAIVVAFTAIALGLLRGLRMPSISVEGRRTAAPIVALIAVVMALLVKGPYVDLDPLNVYFWLFIGAIFGLFRVTADAGGVA
jgi:hypothetical protein